MPIGGINVFAFKVTSIDKGYVNIGPLLVTDWNGLSKQNMGTGEVNGNGNFQGLTTVMLQDSDLMDAPVSKNSVV